MERNITIEISYARIKCSSYKKSGEYIIAKDCIQFLDDGDNEQDTFDIMQIKESYVCTISENISILNETERILETKNKNKRRSIWRILK